MSTRVGVIDYGGGNLRNVLNVLKFLGHEGSLVSSPADLEPVDRLLFPGVGSFGDCVDELDRKKLRQPRRRRHGHRRDEGRSLLLSYNMVRREVATPIPGHGVSLFDDGTLVVFRDPTGEPTRIHQMQVWRTPFVSDTHHAATPPPDGYLARVGNAELVRGISDALALRLRGTVDGILAGEAVGRAGPVDRGIGVGQQAAVALGHQQRVAGLEHGAELLRGHHGLGRRHRVEGGGRVLDIVPVDGGQCRNVAPAERTDQ